MKAILNAKVLTGVAILIFSCLSLGAEVTRTQCNSKCDAESKTSCTKPAAGAPNDEVNKYNQCVRDAKQACIERDGCTELESTKEIKQACEAAFEKYRESASKEKLACDAFAKEEGKKSCSDRAAACQKKLESLANPFATSTGEDPSDDTTGFGALTQIAMTSIYQDVGLNQNQNGSLAAQGGVCVKSIDRKARKEDKEKKDKERKELLDKITKQKSEILDLKKDLDKERNENTEKINEVAKDSEKERLSKEKTISDATSEVAKKLVEIGKRIRAYNLAVTKEMQNLANENFEYQTKMQELTDSKVNIRCKQEFESYKAALVSGGAIGGGASPEDKAKIAALAAQYKAKGLRGSGEMKQMLIATRKACFESANTARNKTRLANSQSVKNIQDKVDEFKNLIKEEKKALTDAQKDLETNKSQIDKEKQAAETAKGAELDALSKKLAAQIENTEEKTAVAKEKIQELTAEINKLVIVENFEVEDAYSEATEAIENGISARKRTLESCNCSANPSTVICSMLGKDQTNYDGKKAPKRPTEGKK